MSSQLRFPSFLIISLLSIPLILHTNTQVILFSLVFASVSNKDFPLIKVADENWDDDFVHTISPSALQRPQLQLQDNFGGRLSSERLKALASSPYRNFGDENSSGSYLSQDDFSDNSRDELKTVRPSRSQPLPEAKIRDYKAARTPPSGPPRFRDRQKTLTQDDPRGMKVLKQSPLKASPMPVSPPKSQLGTRFGLPSRSVSLHKEKSNDDFSGLDFDDDVPLNLRPGLESVCYVLFP